MIIFLFLAIFATGSRDGCINVWDTRDKGKIKMFAGFVNIILKYFVQGP